MLVSENQALRITYEAYSRFSNSLIRCRTFDDVAACFKVNLKYLFNFHVFRASYHRGSYYLHLTVTSGGANMQVQHEAGYLAHEEVLLEKGIPACWKELEPFLLPEEYKLPEDEQGELWGWLIRNDEKHQVLVSVLSGTSKLFTKKDITFLKLATENLKTKLLEICLFNELDEKNKYLKDALVTIHEKNTEITSIIEQQKEIIASRTKEIADKNEKLLQISVLNAHDVREPLTRIMGLMSLMEHYASSDDIKDKFLPKLKASSEDLDKALQHVISKATTDLLKLKA
ncbi:hypothetical protein ACFSKU_13795 [Pontibacter silvestris]|uniref:histidine kinase n=1 Tax=Pontibacter silvestris TaxID=2305183 RepID=A0ABW4X0D1_9BACT|nr:hypothetical protein [Pontibacter silvestris]MCC9135477.1 hypothetical protein [Pontibacter silvestris]